MPFWNSPGDPYRNPPQKGDLFYGLARTRDDLMKAFNISFDPGDGARINSYDIGDIALPVDKAARPADNQEFVKYLGVHPKYSKVVNIANSKYEWRHWRQKSKGGIEWATRTAKKHVHFCLDKMTDPAIMFAIVNKCYDNDSPAHHKDWDTKVRSITNAELRWMYRHRLESGVQKYVQFWENKQPCGPPWERPELQDIWDAYSPRIPPSTWAKH